MGTSLLIEMLVDLGRKYEAGTKKKGKDDLFYQHLKLNTETDSSSVSCSFIYRSLDEERPTRLLAILICPGVLSDALSLFLAQGEIDCKHLFDVIPSLGR
ncbi:hypothetical protein J6590_016444 [Homalodisca vitripennis]|nr:hypothetical protein J6590_016444 [Homalodisca vitripennis]